MIDDSVIEMIVIIWKMTYINMAYGIYACNILKYDIGILTSIVYKPGHDLRCSMIVYDPQRAIPRTRKLGDLSNPR